MGILVWNSIKALIFNIRFVLAAALSCFLYAQHLNIVERKIKFFFKISASGLYMMMMTNTTNEKGKKSQTVTLSQGIFENMLQIFHSTFFRGPSALCPDNDPGQPHLPEILLFFWALISLTVGSCNYRIRLPKRSALSRSLCSVLRGLSPDQ